MNESRSQISFRRAQHIEQDEGLELKLRGFELEVCLAGEAGLDHAAALAHAIRRRLLAIVTRPGVAVRVFPLGTERRLHEAQRAMIGDHQP